MRPREGTQSAWLVWYYKSFNLSAQYDVGSQSYAIRGSATKDYVSIQGFLVTAFHFVTGEPPGQHQPLRDFAIEHGRITGLGAVEVHTQFSRLELGRKAFNFGLGAPNLWTNRVDRIDTEAN